MNQQPHPYHQQQPQAYWPQPQPQALAPPATGLSSQRIATIIVGTAGMLGTFLPWLTMPIVGAVYGTSGDGWFSFGGFAAIVLLAVLGDRPKPMSLLSKSLAELLALGCAVLVGWKIYQFQIAVQEMSDRAGSNKLARRMAEAMTANAQVGPGLFLVGAAAVLLIVLLPILGRKKA